MCHALVFNIHHVVTHSTRVPLFLPPSPIRADPSESDGGRTAHELDPMVLLAPVLPPHVGREGGGIM